VTHYTITTEDSMMILASDGVWEFLSSQARTYITYIHTYAYHIANA